MQEPDGGRSAQPRSPAAQSFGAQSVASVISNPTGATIGSIGSGTGIVVITEPNPYGRVTGGNGGANGMGGGNT